MSLVRNIVENERGLHDDTVATDKEVQATSGYRNHIVDGSFSLCQKSDTPIDGTGYSCVDIWWQDDCKIERDYDENGLTYAKCTCTDAERYKFILQKVENARVFNYKTITVSFELDSPDGLTAGRCTLGSHNTDDDYIMLGSISFNYNSTRTRYSFTFNIDEASIMGNGFPLYVYIVGDNTSNNNDGKVFNVYNVQLEFGDIATPFEVRPKGLELLLCQRYYEYLDLGTSNRSCKVSDDNNTSDDYWQKLVVFTEKRCVPSAVTSFNDHTPAHNPDRLSVNSILYSDSDVGYTIFNVTLDARY